MIRKIALRSRRPIQGLNPEAMELMMNYPWPGNVRELINVLEYAFVVCKEKWIKPEHLPAYLHQRPGRVQALESRTSKIAAEEPEKIRLQKALNQAEGKKSEAARALGISRVTLWKKIKKFNLSP
jgi:transcriptional regulator with PAS, ATPase and Fis domain